jgi:glycine/D-amino acid oxidase-like deaminating enzyme/nitrite reductase/ring-hydroxylating ferredoxin subunit
MTTPVPAPEPHLAHDARADLCIVGAGIAGLSTAYHCARQGLSVVVVDDGPVGGGQTQRTTAHLSNAIDDRYTEIERLHGSRGACLAADSHTAAIDRIEQIVADEGIACDFERLDGYLFTGPGDPADALDGEWQAAQRAGLTGVERLSQLPGNICPTAACLRFPHQGQCHPLKYLGGLAAAVARRGGRIYTGTHVDQVRGGRTAQVHVAGGPVITAGSAVVATNSPINDRMVIHTKQGAYLTYVIAARVPRGAVPKALYWDTLDPYHYVRLQPDGAGNGEWLVVGGEDHRTGQASDQGERYARLETWTRAHFPMAQDVVYRWSGQVMEPIDGLAFIGRNPLDQPNVYIATGDSGMGMTHGTIAGMLITDLILGRDNPWAILYNPSRKTGRAAGQYYQENVNVFGQYADWLSDGDAATFEDIAPGHGAVVRSGLVKVAAYRDARGGLHVRSAVCRHLGCIVHWNDAEKTWDCPCHGSRYAADGRVLNGPSASDLPPASVGWLSGLRPAGRR